MGTSETGNLQLKRTQFDLVQLFPFINTVNLRICLQQEGQSWAIGGAGRVVGVEGGEVNGFGWWCSWEDGWSWLMGWSAGGAGMWV